MMYDHGFPSRPVIMTLPDEIDITNADQVGEQLLAAIVAGVTVVIADLTVTTYCDSSGIRHLLRAHDQAEANNAQLRLAVGTGAVLRVVQLMALDRVLRIYPGLSEALVE